VLKSRALAHGGQCYRMDDGYKCVRMCMGAWRREVGMNSMHTTPISTITPPYAHSKEFPGVRHFGGDNASHHSYVQVRDAACRTCGRPCTRAISCLCQPCAGHFCNACMFVPCTECNRRLGPKMSRITRRCVLCDRACLSHYNHLPLLFFTCT
jgi:hypothetical protein